MALSHRKYYNFNETCRKGLLWKIPALFELNYRIYIAV